MWSILQRLSKRFRWLGVRRRIRIPPYKPGHGKVYLVRMFTSGKWRLKSSVSTLCWTKPRLTSRQMLEEERGLSKLRRRTADHSRSTFLFLWFWRKSMLSSHQSPCVRIDLKELKMLSLMTSCSSVRVAMQNFHEKLRVICTRMSEPELFLELWPGCQQI